MNQPEAVIEAMRQNGGYATFGDLNHLALQVPGVHWGTKTPFASIRRIVQKRPEFFKVRPGLWALEEARHLLPVEVQALMADAPPTPKVQDFTHYYYQGLLVQIGNLRHMATFVPHQDKNKPFLSGTLAEQCTLSHLPAFTHPELMSKAATVDVSWFNDRRMPRALYEVEHTTDIHTSLLKFAALEDFRTTYTIVADKARYAEFADKVAHSSFKDIRPLVKFMDYDTVADLHSKTLAGAAAEAILSGF